MNFLKPTKVFPDFIKTKPVLKDNFEENFIVPDNKSFPKELLNSQVTGSISKNFSRNVKKKLLNSYELDGFIEEMESNYSYDTPYVSDLAFDKTGELFVSTSTSGVIEIFNIYQYLQSSYDFKHSYAFASTLKELKDLSANQIHSKKRKREDNDISDDERPNKKPMNIFSNIERLLSLYNGTKINNNFDKENNQNILNTDSNNSDNNSDGVIYLDGIEPLERYKSKMANKQAAALKEKLKFRFTEAAVTYHTKYKTSAVKWSPTDQDFMYTGFLSYNKIFIYDIALDSPDPVGFFSTPGSGTNELAFLPGNSRSIFAGGRDGVLRMFDLQGQSDRPSLSFANPSQSKAINSIEPAIEGDKIYLLHPDASVSIWDIRAQRLLDTLSMESIMFKAIYPLSRPGPLLSLTSVPYDSKLLAVNMGHCSGLLNVVTKQFEACGLVTKDAENSAGESLLPGRSGFKDDLFYTTDPRNNIINYFDFQPNQISAPFAQVRASKNITAVISHQKFNYVLAGLDDNSTDVLGSVSPVKISFESELQSTPSIGYDIEICCLGQSALARLFNANKKIQHAVQLRYNSKTKEQKAKENHEKIIKFDYNRKYFNNTPITLQRFPDSRGRVLTAKERIEAGQVILISKPYALTVKDEYKAQVCSKCHNKLELAEQIIPSKFVKSRQYCCQHCYDSAELIDYLEAKPLKRINMLPRTFLRQAAGDSKDTAELILRILTRKFIEERPRLNCRHLPLPPKLTDDTRPSVNNNDTADLIHASNKSNFGGKSVKQPLLDDGLTFQDVERLVANMSTVPEKRDAEAHDIVKALHQCMDPRMLIPDDEIHELICRIDCNSFAIDKYERRVLAEQDSPENIALKAIENWSGNGLYLTASYFNHSCVPNCKFYHDMDCNIVIESRRAIDAGEELTISYGLGMNGNEDLDEIRDICKREVQKTFRFACNCTAITK